MGRRRMPKKCEEPGIRRELWVPVSAEDLLEAFDDRVLILREKVQCVYDEAGALPPVPHPVHRVVLSKAPDDVGDLFVRLSEAELKPQGVVRAAPAARRDVADGRILQAGHFKMYNESISIQNTQKNNEKVNDKTIFHYIIEFACART